MSQVVPPEPKTRSWALWVQLLAGPILWSVYFLLGYMLVETVCQAGWSFTVLGFPGLSFLIIGLTLLAILGAAGFSLKSYRGWRAMHTDRSLQDEFRESSHWFEGPADFMYFSGFLLSVLFQGSQPASWISFACLQDSYIQMARIYTD